MNLTVRIPKSVLSEAQKDLDRPHPFAYERVGFFRCRPTDRSDIVVITGYDGVPDEHYVCNAMVGACIGVIAIQLAMQRVLTYKVGQIHIHKHGHLGPPSPSSIDLTNQPRLVTSFRILDPTLPHGFMILSDTHVWGSFGIPGQQRMVEFTSASVVSGRVEFL